MNRNQIKRLQQASLALDLTGQARADLFDQVTHYAAHYLDSIATSPAYGTPPDKADLVAGLAIKEQPIDTEELFDLIATKVDTVGIDPSSGRFLGFIPGGGLVYSGLGDLLAAVANRYPGVYHASPGAATIEAELLKWMGGVLGYPSSASGYLASGGSLANLTAIVTAREAHGVVGDAIPYSVVYLTEHVHHCIDKALHIAGLGGCIQRKVSVDDHYRMDADALEAAIQADVQAGLQPWLVVGSAGTTNTGAVDPLQTIGEIASAHDLWFHIDGAYGGLFKLCPEGQAILKGTERSDSIVVDPHKTLFLPYGLGAVLVKDASKQFAAFNAHADYMDVVRDNDELSQADLSPELTKHFRGLRMWLPLRLVGVEPFQAALSEKIGLARYFHQQIQSIPGFEAGPYPDLSVATYRYRPQRGDINDFNQRLMDAIIAEGQVYLTSTRLNGDIWLRAAILSFRTHLEEVDVALDRLRVHAARLANS